MTVQVEIQQKQQPGELARDFAALRRRRMMGLVNGVTVASLTGGGTDRLTRSGIVRPDLRRSFGTATGVARGVPLTVRLRLVSANSGRPLSGHAVYLWHADRDGAYSLHSPGLTGQNYLRGVQGTDDNGWVTFTTIFPGASGGRWPHLHFEAAAGVTGQVALPSDVCARVYAVRGYEESATHLALAHPMAEDGGDLAMATVTGDLGRGLVATRTMSI
ncbi:intradiol ring-cleavage dioxygenase [Actinoplanes sp. M2I2]|uniref:dioxygenase family protein n=1 Tax=Actinoplanes sp. M2I2 TaxID=1734444 RepID=UPI00202240B9|nr:intradiol ring-cleavage dioxygenase [Actinoplanes sp. M2I2]